MRVRVLSALLCALLLFNACGSSSTALPTIPIEATPVPANGTPTSDDVVTISLGAFDYDRANLEPILTRFNEEHPTIKVVMTSLDDVLQTMPDKNGQYPPDSMASMLRRIVSVADVAPSSWITPEVYGTPLLRDIKPYMDADTAFQRDDYFPSILDRYAVNGAQYILPRTVSIQTMAYNKDAFAAAQVPEPARDWSSVDMLAVAEKLTKSANGTIERYGFYDNNGGSIVLLYLLADAGVDVLGMSPRDLKVGDQKIVGALQKYADLVNRGVIFAQQQIAYGANEMGSYVDPSELIRNGRVAMWTDGSVYSPDGSPAVTTFNTGYTTLPHGPHEDINFYTEGYVMSGGTAHPNEAWTLMEWLSRQNLNPTATVYAGYMAARQSLQAQMSPNSNDDKVRSDAYTYTISNLKPVKHYNGQDFAVFYTLSAATMGFYETPPKTAADIVANVVKNLNDSSMIAQQTPSPTPDIRPVTVATPEPDQAREGQTSISFASYGTSMTDLRRMVRAFKKEDDSIFVKIVSTDNLTTTQTIAMAANRSDCFWWNSGVPTSAEDKAALADLQPLIDNDTNIGIDDIPVALLDAYRSDGQLLGFPHTYSTRALVYQDTLFQKLGIDTPQASWSSDDFLKAAKALTNDGTYGYSAMGNYNSDILFWSSRFGGSLTTGNGKDLRANFSDPAVTAAITWWIELATTQRVMPMPVFDYKRTGSTGSDPSWELQSQGKIGMWLDSGNSYAKQTVTDPSFQAPVFTALMAPPPVGERGLVASDLTMSGYHIAANASNPQACMSFINFMSRQASNTMYGGIPARKSQSNSTVFEEQNSYSVPLRDAMANLLEQPLDTTSAYSNSSYIETYWLYQALDNVVYRKADIGQELQKAQTKTNDYLACVATIDGSKKSPTYASCAKKADPDYNGYMSDEAAP